MYRPEYKGRTSADYLLGVAEQKFKPVDGGGELDLRLIILTDMYIKARSYALLNKFAFIASLVFVIIAIIFPAAGFLFPNEPIFHSTVLQAVNGALAALSYAFYSTYKRRQTISENIMREILFSTKNTEDLVADVMSKISIFDIGFDFQSVKGDQSKRE